MVGIIDIGMGNLRSVGKAVERLGYRACHVRTPEEAAASSLLILPGVGHFGVACERLRQSKLEPALRAHVADGKPLVGICLGMQLLFASSQEGGCEGLGFFPGEVVRFSGAMKVPQMGWNEIRHQGGELFAGIEDGAFVYFVHSYYAPVSDDTIARAEYGTTYSAMVRKGHIVGCQFHPEKSQAVGLRLLGNVLSTLTALPTRQADDLSLGTAGAKRP